MYLNTIILLQYCWCHSGCSCLNGYDIVMFLGCWVLFLLFHSLLEKSESKGRVLFLFLFHINVKCMSIFLKSWSTPMSITGHNTEQPIFILQRFATPHRVLRAQGEWVFACVDVSAFQSARAVWIRQQSLQDQSLSMKSCTICKKCTKKIEKKKDI